VSASRSDRWRDHRPWRDRGQSQTRNRRRRKLGTDHRLAPAIQPRRPLPGPRSRLPRIQDQPATPPTRPHPPTRTPHRPQGQPSTPTRTTHRSLTTPTDEPGSAALRRALPPAHSLTDFRVSNPQVPRGPDEGVGLSRRLAGMSSASHDDGVPADGGTALFGGHPVHVGLAGTRWVSDGVNVTCWSSPVTVCCCAPTRPALPMAAGADNVGFPMAGAVGELPADAGVQLQPRHRGRRDPVHSDGRRGAEQRSDPDRHGCARAVGELMCTLGCSESSWFASAWVRFYYPCELAARCRSPAARRSPRRWPMRR
jgi:hypothetical protein